MLNITLENLFEKMNFKKFMTKMMEKRLMLVETPFKKCLKEIQFPVNQKSNFL